MTIRTEHRVEHVHKVAPDEYGRGRRGRQCDAQAHWQESFNARVEALALLATFIGIGILVNLIIFYIIAQVLGERRENEEHRARLGRADEG